MQDLSFRWPHPRFRTEVGEVSVRIHTPENVYGLDPGSVETVEHTDGFDIHCGRLTWAGGQQTADGSAMIAIRRSPSGMTVAITAKHPDTVRCVALTIHDLQRGDITGLREGSLPVGSEGRLVSYPNGWFDLATPLLALRHSSGAVTVARNLDDQVRPKRFAVIPHFSHPDLVDFELIVDADASSPSEEMSAPVWELDRVTDLAPVYQRHAAHVREAYNIPTWEARDDVPAWLRQTALVVTLHGMHFTGRIFLDYAAMLECLRRLTREIDGARILAYLPGWEGRYYRHYGRYAADLSLGGAEGFHALVDGAHELGVRIMPMFGANVAARDLPGFESWGAPGQLLNASGHMPIGSVDWDASRHFDHGWGALINPSYAPWRAHLTQQIVRLHEQYGFDGAFLDISAMYNNDPRGSTTQGLRMLVDGLRNLAPDLLIAGEAWFDGLAGVIPLVQTGHRDTVPVFHDQPVEDLFTYSNRSFGHVCLGDPAYGSTGCHEAGYNDAWRLPVREGVIPTLNLVDGSLDAARDRVAEIVQDAHAYAAKFLE